MCDKQAPWLAVAFRVETALATYFLGATHDGELCRFMALFGTFDLEWMLSSIRIRPSNIEDPLDGH